MKIFLDLEETIIESWQNPLLMNVQKLREWIDERRNFIDSVGVFSFAIWNETDRTEFVVSGMQEDIERALGIKITEILTVPQICKEVFWKSGTVMSVNEFITIWGKQRAFIDWSLLTQSGHVVLIDDVVQNLEIIDHDRALRINLINVNKM